MLKMELDDLKAAWQREKAAYSREIDTKAILAETKKLALKRDRDFKRQQMTQILCSLISLGFMSTWCRRDNPLLANAGLIVMLLCIALMVAGVIILRIRQRESHPWLPSEKFLAEERKKVCDRIALLRRNATWFFIPGIAGFLTWQIALSHSLQMVIALAGVAAIASAVVFYIYRWKLKKELLPELETIDRDIEEERKNAETFSWSD
jgi:hypothetical protein